jgi:YgiT-type zinc finger domain-containing protein
MTSCNVCHGKVEKKLTTFTQWYRERFVIVENVPAWVCERCGETYYDPDIAEQVQSLVWSEAKPVRTVETPVYDLALSGQ